MGRYAVTFDEWDAARGRPAVSRTSLGSRLGARTPAVINVYWEDAQAYIKWLSFKTGQPYRLLSEAEWEYCCRAGTEDAFLVGRRDFHGTGELQWKLHLWERLERRIPGKNLASR